MAEVTGDFGGQPIQLNNAATEATLKQLLAAMTVIANNTGKDKAAQAKSQQELEKELKKLAAAAKKQQAAQDKLTEAQKKKLEADNKQLEIDKKLKEADEAKLKAQQKQLDQMNFVSDKLSQLGSTVTGLATGMTGMLSSLANLGDSLTSTAQVFTQIPIVGGVLGSMFGAVAGAAEKTYEAFKKSASVGANFGGSMTEMMDAATGAGLTFEQFSGILAKTGKDLALLGGDSEAGARRLAALGKQIKGTPLAGDLNRLGYSTEAINEGMASYAAQLAKTGSLQGMSNSQLIAQTGSYLKDLDALTKLTGQSKKELEDQRNARMKDAQFRLIASKLDAESQKNLHALMDSIPAEHQEGMKEIIATGTATSEAGKKALAFLPQSARNMMQLNQQIRTTGKMGANQAAQINAAYQNEVKNFTKSGVAENMALYGDEASKRFFVGAADAAAREKTMGQIQAEQQKVAAERATKEKELKDKQLDPASMEEYKNKIAETSNEFTKFLANSGLLDIMMESFRTLVDVVELVVVPAFRYVVDNFDNIVVAGGILIGSFLAYKGIIALATLKQSLQTLGITLSLAPLKAMAVNALSAAGNLLKMGVASFMALGPFAKIALVVGALYLAFKALYNSGWDLGTIFEAVGDKLYDIFVLGFKDLMTSILAFLGPKFGGISKDEAKARRESIAAERKDLKQRELVRDAKRAENRTARGVEEVQTDAKTATTEATEVKEKETVAGRAAARAKEKEVAAANKVAAAKEAEVAAAKAAAAGPSGVPGIDLSNPQKMFDSMVRRQKGETAGATNQPGTTTTQPLASPAAGNNSAAAPGLPTGPILSQSELKGPQKEFYDKMYKTLLEQAKKEGVKNPEAIARLGAAQSSIETGYGKSTAGGNNYFGIKDFSGKGGNVQSTQEWDAKQGKMVTIKDSFRKYNSMEESAGDYIKFLKQNSRYKDVLNANSTEEAIAAQGKTGYATDPNYVNKLAWVQSAANGRQAVNIPGAPRPTTATAQTPPSTVPTTAVAQTAVTPTPTGATTQQADAARAAAAANDPRRTDRPQTAVAGARQETPESLLASLNTKMDQLIAINQKLKDVGESQLSATRGLSNDMFSYGAG